MQNPFATDKIISSLFIILSLLNLFACDAEQGRSLVASAEIKDQQQVINNTHLNKQQNKQLSTLVTASSVDKNPQDLREYQAFTLDNGLEVVVISDAKLAESSAAISVGVGMFQDPDEFQGLAHYLEHMLWQSSKKYPEVDALQKLIAKTNGSTNAFTNLQQTQYFFSTTPQSFELALDMLSAAITEPLLDPVIC